MKCRFLSFGLILGGLSLASLAQTVQVDQAWVRATVKGQMATGAFMKIKAEQGGKLVAVSTPVAGVAEIHEMKMSQNVMKMSAVPALDLPANQWVELRPGGYHLMLMDLKSPLSESGSVTLNLVFEDAKGVRSTQQVQVPVKAMSGQGASGDAHSHHKH
jgi:copper(I)-binding protein